MTPGAGPEVHLDVREDIHRGEEPFARIMAAVDSLPPDGVLVLRAPFEPVPLYRVLGKRGFGHAAERTGDNDWTVRFSRQPLAAGPAAAAAPGAPSPAPPPAPAAGTPAAALRTMTLDVRGLEAPLPMVRVLERLDTLGPDEQLEVLHARRPLLLYPQLEARGFVHDTAEVAPGLVRIVIRRAGAPSPR